MRRAAIFAMVSGFLEIGIRYGLDGRWEMAGVCLLAGGLWLFPSPRMANQRATVSLLFLAGAGAVGVYLGYEPVWMLTHFILLMIAWDLDHFTRALRPWIAGREEGIRAAFSVHLKRLGIVAGAGWGLGMLALSVRFPTSFTAALLLGLVVFLSLRGIVRVLGQGYGSNTE